MKTEVIVYLLQSDKINIKTIDKVFNSISFSEQQKLKVLAEFYKRRKNISSRAEECYNVSNKLLKSFLMSSKYQLTRNKISEEDLKFFFSQMKENYTLYRYVLYKIISILDEQQLIRMLIIIPHFKENEWFIIIRRSLELENKFIYYDSRDKIQSYTKAKKLQILSKYYSEGGISQTEVDEGFKNIDEHYFIDFVNLISPKLKLISNKTNYFDLRYSKNKQMLFLSNIIDRVKIGKKFIFVRLSDGESYGYTNDNELSRRQEVHWWGEVLSEELRNKIKNDFSNAIFTTRFDFLGIPTHYKYIHYIANKNNKEISIKDNLDTNVINRLSFSLFSIIDAYSNERVCVDNFVEDQINNVMFTKENLRVLSKNANRTIVISGYKEKHIHETFNNDSIIVKEIPTHNLLSGSDKTCNSSLPLPYKYDEVREWISSNVKNGDLCFISAGFIGKIFACDALKNGAIVLDIGQSLNKDGI